MNTSALVTPKAGAVPRSDARRGAYLFSPVVDFLCFGGSSLVLLPLIFLKPAEEYRAQLTLLTIILANVVNHPHFAHSYQIFYRNFSHKLAGDGRPLGLRARYAFAGIVAPVLMIMFFATTIASGDMNTLGYAANAIAFFVGWHYVKQGYGMLMVDCALKRQFFSAGEKRVFLFNSYAVWTLAWMNLNNVMMERNYFGIPYSTFDIPDALHTLTLTAAIITSGATLTVLARRFLVSGSLPLNGVIGYLVSLYPWLLFLHIEPLWALVVPALHSLQYLAVVYRFEINARRASEDHKRAMNATPQEQAAMRPVARELAGFAFAGIVLGALGFWILPALFHLYAPYDRAVFGASLFFFVFWIFINVHHYFIDNVIWRRDNAETQRYLFAARDA